MILDVKTWLHNKSAQFEILQEDQFGILAIRRLVDNRILHRDIEYILMATKESDSSDLAIIYQQFQYDLIHVKCTINTLSTSVFSLSDIRKTREINDFLPFNKHNL